MNSPEPAGYSDRVAAVTSGARWEPIASGQRAEVWRARFDDERGDLAVKCPAGDTTLVEPARLEAVKLIHAEAERLVWLQHALGSRGLGSPQVVLAPEPDDPHPFLVTRWFEGTTDPRLLRSPELAVESFGRALASLHEASRRVEVEPCPFDASLSSLLDEARSRVEAGLVDTSTHSDPYCRYTLRELLERAEQMAAATREPTATDRVLVHGDLCVTNLVFDPAYGSVVGAIDWSHMGMGDRHVDLAVTARSLARNFSGEVLPDFFAAYGLREPDLLRIEVFTLLEELF